MDIRFPLMEIRFSLKEIRFPLKETRFLISESRFPLKETRFPLKETRFPLTSMLIRDEKNTVPKNSIRSNFAKKRISNFSFWSNFEHRIFFRFFNFAFFRARKQDRCRILKESPPVSAVHDANPPRAVFRWFPVELWRKMNEKHYTFMENQSRTHASEGQLFSRKMTCENVFQNVFSFYAKKYIHFLKQKLIKFWTFHKKFWSLQIVRIVRENRIWFFDQIWVKFDSRFCKNQIALLETIDPNLTFCGRCRYIILNGALSSKNQIPFSL